ncbi:uncharacterized protein BHQ10_003777 [Talaromyces amestolkiae]|uniref:DUF2293 domain-containing protein n=1 Tax=Talaromyces amestolkiae TaxID=1196081 RepID=A0A364KW26_TALAM|nr:uncharacterized protein BHQ10_003777 [Talaromyces amestolkiae]RAO67765.1 hypothetical protein BHQ10_003777 [Talaromyces amestolkiae]
MPEDYIFVPKGDPYITRHCKARTKDEKQTVYIVYDSKFKHQLGIRIPLAIHTTVLESASSTAAHRASATLLRDQRDNIKARSLLLATFPAIPPKCLERVLEHAFLKGSGRVGRISTKTDAKKATLAVEAHIRHEHTGYERLMQEEDVGREEARRRVWGEVRRARDEWAGTIADAREDGEVEEAVKEVEVIDLTTL